MDLERVSLRGKMSSLQQPHYLDNRIMLKVHGWIRNVERKYDLLIPNGIKQICFEYCNFRDEWMAEYAAKCVVFNDHFAKIKGTHTGQITIL